MSGHLEVFSATSATGRDRERHPLLHAKLLIVDRRKLLLGSANLTSYGLSFNFEAGTSARTKEMRGRPMRQRAA